LLPLSSVLFTAGLDIASTFDGPALMGVVDGLKPCCDRRGLLVGFDDGLIFRSGVIRGLLPFSIEVCDWMISISLSTMEARGEENDGDPLTTTLGIPPVAGLVIESLDEGKNTLK
jgi:hypothetical protein